MIQEPFIADTFFPCEFYVGVWDFIIVTVIIIIKGFLMIPIADTPLQNCSGLIIILCS